MGIVWTYLILRVCLAEDNTEFFYFFSHKLNPDKCIQYKPQKKMFRKYPVIPEIDFSITKIPLHFGDKRNKIIDNLN